MGSQEMITEKVLRGQAVAAGANAVCCSGTQMLAMLDAIAGLRKLVRDCSDDEAEWPALVEAIAALKNLPH
jgi:hypothetical protein